MQVESITSLPASDIAKLIQQKKLSPVEVMEAHLRRIEQLDLKINAFASFDSEQARLEAKRAEAALMRGAESKPLLGVPVSIKACIDVQGLSCEAGSRLRAEFEIHQTESLSRSAELSLSCSLRDTANRFLSLFRLSVHALPDWNQPVCDLPRRNLHRSADV